MSFRSHVVSLVAVLFALAAGVALGGGPLTELGRAAPAGPSAADVEAAAQAQRAADFGDEVVSEAADRLYGNGLDGGTVAVVVMPGTPEATVQAVSAEIGAAGGTVVGTHAIEPALVSAGEQALVDTLGSQLMTQLDTAAVPADSTTYDRMGRLLGMAVSTGSPETRASAEDATAIRESLAGAELVETVGTATEQASYVVVLLGEDGDAAEDPIYAGLLDGLTEQSGRVVVAADAEDGAEGRLSRLRADTPAWTTVDGVDATAGRVTTLLALTEWPETRGGAFGASGADGAVGLG
jgi:hypothetical protein